MAPAKSPATYPVAPAAASDVGCHSGSVGSPGHLRDPSGHQLLIFGRVLRRPQKSHGQNGIIWHYLAWLIAWAYQFPQAFVQVTGLAAATVGTLMAPHKVKSEANTTRQAFQGNSTWFHKPGIDAINIASQKKESSRSLAD